MSIYHQMDYPNLMLASYFQCEITEKLVFLSEKSQQEIYGASWGFVGFVRGFSLFIHEDMMSDYWI